jgi:hypothetical protein
LEVEVTVGWTQVLSAFAFSVAKLYNFYTEKEAHSTIMSACPSISPSNRLIKKDLCKKEMTDILYFSQIRQKKNVLKYSMLHVDLLIIYLLLLSS